MQPYFEESSDAHAIKLFASQVDQFALANEFVREGFDCYPSHRSMLIWKVPIAGYFGAVLAALGLKRTEPQHGLSGFPLNYKVGQHLANDRLCACIGGLITEQWASFCKVRFLFVVEAPECIGKQLDSAFVDHADLDSGVISWRFSFLAFIGFGPLDADITLAINQSRKISKCGFKDCHGEMIIT